MGGNHSKGAASQREQAPELSEKDRYILKMKRTRDQLQKMDKKLTMQNQVLDQKIAKEISAKNQV